MLRQTGLRLTAAATMMLAIAACTPGTGGGTEATDDTAPGSAAGAAPAPDRATAAPRSDPPQDTEGNPRPSPEAERGPCEGPMDITQFLLREVRSAAHEFHDRVVFEFCGGRDRTVFVDYVDRIRQNPTGRAIPLAGSAYLEVAISAATLDTTLAADDPSQARRYPGPRRWSPGHRLVKQIAVTGDFESTLSFGLGLAQPATMTVSQLSDPSRVVIDIWDEPLAQFLWPFHTVEQADEGQEAFDEGHQPWVGYAELVIAYYLQREQGWRDAELRRLSDNPCNDMYAAHSSAGDRATVTVWQPTRCGAGGVWVVTWFQPSRAMN